MFIKYETVLEYQKIINLVEDLITYVSYSTILQAYQTTFQVYKETFSNLLKNVRELQDFENEDSSIESYSNSDTRKILETEIAHNKENLKHYLIDIKNFISTVKTIRLDKMSTSEELE